MAASSSSATPKLIIPEEKSSDNKGASRSFMVAALPSNAAVGSSKNVTATKKLTKILSTQASFDRHHHHYPSHPISKRFSIDADPSSIILNTSVADHLSNYSSQSASTTSNSDDISSSIVTYPTSHRVNESSPVRSPSLKPSDSFLEIPYDPNAAAHLTNNGQEVLLEHGAFSQ
jgi:hypothetical protein